MLARAVPRLPGPAALPGGIVFEPKYDGFRLLVFAGADGRVFLQSRNGRDLTGAFPEIADAAAALGEDVVARPSVGRWSAGRRLVERQQVRRALWQTSGVFADSACWARAVRLVTADVTGPGAELLAPRANTATLEYRHSTSAPATPLKRSSARSPAASFDRRPSCSAATPPTGTSSWSPAAHRWRRGFVRSSAVACSPPQAPTTPGTTCTSLRTGAAANRSPSPPSRPSSSPNFTVTPLSIAAAGATPSISTGSVSTSPPTTSRCMARNGPPSTRTSRQRNDARLRQQRLPCFPPSVGSHVRHGRRRGHHALPFSNRSSKSLFGVIRTKIDKWG